MVRICRSVLVAALLISSLGLVGGCLGSRDTTKAPVNVIVVLLDTVRADRLSTYGYARDTTPNLTSFAHAGVLFEQARSQASCTYPSVNSLLTSRWPAEFMAQPEARIGIPNGTPALQEILKARGYRTIAVSASPIVRKSPSQHNRFGGFERGFDVFDETCYHRRADCVNRRARRYLNRTDEPFFLYLHYMDAHSVYVPPSPFRERFVEPYPEARPWILEGNPRPLQLSLSGRGSHVDVSPRDVRYLSGLYDGEIAYLDSQLGLLFADLRARGLFERSVVIVASDHGEEFFDEHGRILHCELLTESSIKIPLIVRSPNLERTGRIRELAENLDIVPTVLDYLGLPADPAHVGRSLRTAIRGGSPAPEASHALQYSLRSITDGTAKLVFDQGTGRFELFDLVADPGERHDVLAANRRVYRQLRERLEAWMKDREGGLATAGSLDRARESERQLKALGYLQ